VEDAICRVAHLLSFVDRALEHSAEIWRSFCSFTSCRHHLELVFSQSQTGVAELQATQLEADFRYGLGFTSVTTPESIAPFTGASNRRQAMAWPPAQMGRSSTRRLNHLGSDDPGDPAFPTTKLSSPFCHGWMILRSISLGRLISAVFCRPALAFKPGAFSVSYISNIDRLAPSPPASPDEFPVNGG